jgi:hypothetical protein
MLTPEQRDKAGVYILSHEASIFSQIFSPLDRKGFHERLADEAITARLNQLWAENNEVPLSPLSLMFGLGDEEQANEGMDYIYVMGGRKRFQTRPFIAVDYINPSLERVKRNFLKALGESINTIIISNVPGANFILSTIYEMFVMDNVKKAELWEARLASQLHLAPGDHYEDEIRILYGQRINPFELNFHEEREFIARARALLGI